MNLEMEINSLPEDKIPRPVTFVPSDVEKLIAGAGFEQRQLYLERRLEP